MPVGGKLVLKGGETLPVEKKIKKKAAKKDVTNVPEGEQAGELHCHNWLCAFMPRRPSMHMGDSNAHCAGACWQVQGPAEATSRLGPASACSRARTTRMSLSLRSSACTRQRRARS